MHNHIKNTHIKNTHIKNKPILKNIPIKNYSQQKILKRIILMQALLKHIIKGSFNQFYPILITDIDGVLVRGTTPINTTLNALHKIRQHKIPFACLTNGGGKLQISKAQQLNQIFNINNYFTAQYMFLNHTPLKPQILKSSQNQEWILVTGSLNIEEVLHDLNVKNYVTCDQLYSLFLHNPTQISNVQIYQNQDYPFFKSTQNNPNKVKQNIQKRSSIKIPQRFKQWALKINTIFALNDVSPYQTALQVIHNVLKINKNHNNNDLKYFAAQNDIIWAGGYHKPRMAFGPFNYILENHCQKNAFFLNKCYFGKPQFKTFKFVAQKMKQKYITKNQPCFFMVGDNPRADIRGANRANWASFLTQTGIHQGSQNDVQDPATVVVKDFNQAVDLIIELKRKLTII